MKRLLFRADDLGYSEGINYGIEKSVRCGLISSVGIMINMPAAVHGVKLMEKLSVCLGLHANICVGKPIAKAEQIKSLVKENGEFHSSSEYRNSCEELCVLDEVITEIEAQYDKYCLTVGCAPHYIDTHAINSPVFMKGVQIVAERHGVKYSHFVKGGGAVTIGKTEIYIIMESDRSGYDPEEALKRIVETEPDNRDYMFVFHPGYLDGYIMNTSSLTSPRPIEVDMLCNPDNKKYLEQNHIICINYDDL